MSIINTIMNSAAFNSIKDIAINQVNKDLANPQEGSVFDAFSKLGIKNTDDLKAGFELFKENPSEALSTAFKDLKEKGFKLKANNPAISTIYMSASNMQNDGLNLNS